MRSSREVTRESFGAFMVKFHDIRAIDIAGVRKKRCPPVTSLAPGRGRAHAAPAVFWSLALLTFTSASSFQSSLP